MSQYQNVITKINKYILKNTIVTDVGSTKESSSKQVRKLLNNNKVWIPSHPITGSEVSGAKHGDKNLFKKKWCVLIKEKNTKKKYLSKLTTFWKKFGLTDQELKVIEYLLLDFFLTLVIVIIDRGYTSTEKKSSFFK